MRRIKKKKRHPYKKHIGSAIFCSVCVNHMFDKLIKSLNYNKKGGGK